MTLDRFSRPASEKEKGFPSTEEMISLPQSDARRGPTTISRRSKRLHSLIRASLIIHSFIHHSKSPLAHSITHLRDADAVTPVQPRASMRSQPDPVGVDREHLAAAVLPLVMVFIDGVSHSCGSTTQDHSLLPESERVNARSEWKQ